MKTRFLVWTIAACLQALSGCGDNPGAPNTDVYASTVRLSFRDLTTAVTPEAIQTATFEGAPIPISVTLSYADLDSFVAGEQASWEGNLRVVRWPSLEPAEGRWVLTAAAPEGGVVMTFVPSSGLAEGWYALQINFPAMHERAGGIRRGILYSRYPVFDDWTTSRFHVGSLPVLSLEGAILARDGVATESNVVFAVSEQVFSSTPVEFRSVFHVTANGAEVPCSITEGDPSDDLQLRVGDIRCDLVDPGALVVISIDDVFRSASGVALHDLEGRSPPRFEYVADERATLPTAGDGLFTVTAERSSP